VKNILLITFIVTAALSLSAQPAVTLSKNPNAPVLTFEKTVIDYGLIDQNTNGVREFKFKNTGKSPLIISGAEASCGCTTPEWPKGPIKPGGTGVIKVKYDTSKLGNFNKTVTITSNASVPKQVLQIKGAVRAPAPKEEAQ